MTEHFGRFKVQMASDAQPGYDFKKIQEDRERREQDKRDLEQFKIEMGWPEWFEDSERGRMCAEFAKRNPPDETQDELPSAIKSLKKTSRGWLWPIHSEQAMRSIFWNIFKAGEDGGGCEAIFNCHARDMLANGRAPWPTAKFFRFYDGQSKRLDEIEQAELKKRDGAAGRKRTDKTGRIGLIMEALQVSRQRAYAIDNDGTASFDDRKKLAAAFNHDPARCFPGAWEMLFASRHGRPSGRPTLAQYVNSGSADFDGYPAMERLKAACGLGAIPETFTGIESFIGALEPARITADEALAIWRIGGPWRDPD